MCRCLYTQLTEGGVWGAQLKHLWSESFELWGFASTDSPCLHSRSMFGQFFLCGGVGGGLQLCSNSLTPRAKIKLPDHLS